MVMEEESTQVTCLKEKKVAPAAVHCAKTVGL